MSCFMFVMIYTERLETEICNVKFMISYDLCRERKGCV